MQWVSLTILMLFPISSTPTSLKAQGQKPLQKKVVPSIRAKMKTDVVLKKTKARQHPQLKKEQKQPSSTANKPKQTPKPKASKKKRATKHTLAADQTQKQTKSQVSLIPYIEDKSVSVQTLKNGLVAWCKAVPQWKIVQVRASIAAGSATDPKGLSGTARFLAHLLQKRLNRGKNPPHNFLPSGGNIYSIKLGKDWVDVRTQIPAKSIPESLQHLARVLHQKPTEHIAKALRQTLEKSAESFPPPSLLERVDSYLFGKSSRGNLLRGRKETFKKISAFRLQTSHEELYTASRTRLLIVGDVDCSKVQAQIKRDFQALPSTNKNPKALFTKSSIHLSSRLFLAREIFKIYQLPQVTREDHLPLYLLHQISQKELRRKLNRTFGEHFPFYSAMRLTAYNGYMLFVLPSQLTRRKRLEKQIEEAIGNLRMSPYHPQLKQRIASYQKILGLELEEVQQSSEKLSSFLLAQLQLPSKKHRYPRAIAPFVKQLKIDKIRRMARLYMGQAIAIKKSGEPFSFQRIILFIGTLLLIWVLLDQTFRRSRKNDE